MMITRIALCAVLIATVSAGANAQQTKTKAGAKTTQAKKAVALQIPKDAEKIDANVWRARDASGKVWLYYQTPFGVTRTEEKSVREAQAPLSAPGLRLVELTANGAVFERTTPFGISRWTRVESDFTADERAVVEQHRNRESEKPNQSAK